ncbi:MAG: Dyp-type peroxidase [Nocardioidaceae bacterium]
MTQEPRTTRRGLLGYAGSTVAGAAAGAGIAAAVASRGDDDAVEQVRPVLPGTVSPFGAHQPGVTAPTPAVTRLLALDAKDGLDRDALGRLMRAWTGTIAAATQGRAAPGDTARDLAQANTDLTVTVGWGPGLFEKAGLADQRPPALADIPPMEHDRLQDAWSGGDLLLMLSAADDTTVTHVARRLLLDSEPFARTRWEQEGSWRGLGADHLPHTGRNLFGQVDGTANLPEDDPLFDSTVWAKTPGWFAGGTTMVVRRIRMDLDLWDTLTRQEQERAIGRDLAVGAPLTGTHEREKPAWLAKDDAGKPVIPLDAHMRMSHAEFVGGARMLRRGVNYTTFDPHTGARESGLVFCSFQADVDAQFTPIQRNLDKGDALNAWTTAIGSAVFAILPGFTEDGWLGDTLLA